MALRPIAADCGLSLLLPFSDFFDFFDFFVGDWIVDPDLGGEVAVAEVEGGVVFSKWLKFG